VAPGGLAPLGEAVSAAPLRSQLRPDGVVPLTLVSEVLREESDSAQVKTALFEHHQDRREPPRGSPHLDAQVGLGLGEMKNLGAVGEPRRTGVLRVEPATIDSADVSDELRFDAPH